MESWARARLKLADEDVAEALVALREKPGMSVRHGLPKPDPSGIVDKTPPLSVTKPLGWAFWLMNLARSRQRS